MAYALIQYALLDGDRVILDIGHLGSVIQVEDKLLARRQCG